MFESNMRGKICLVTGSTSGMGKITARELASRGATVVLVGRNREKGEATQAEIRRETGNENVGLLIADLSLLQDVRRLAAEFQQTYQHLHVLINNAGAIYHSRNLTSEGLEVAFVVNYLAPFLLAELLVETLKASAPARIVNVSSQVHTIGSIAFDNLQGEKHYTTMNNYAQAKLALILFTYEMARCLEGTGVTVNVMSPGMMAGDNFNAEATGLLALVTKLARPFIMTAEQGAQTEIYLATSPQLEGVTGKCFAKSQEQKSSRRSYDQALGQRLWQESRQLVARSMIPSNA
ncbi:SDR family oxidoreductase [Dictyobacter arantiisoli]|uniref:Short-chain dehydrogenase n=1 Tax=Dictyobacter arantiisoli TaxID=2014874 RepID=A0A5A5TJZ2_9CHLR|nr:SDR family oxidoreductase [Dictyobacter arantiisoli]GCF11558.1 short-chain dehydrogenase [Dictyobacter arantiisoli]